LTAAHTASMQHVDSNSSSGVHPVLGTKPYTEHKEHVEGQTVSMTEEEFNSHGKSWERRTILKVDLRLLIIRMSLGRDV
jgi:hypothetical protein